MKITDIETENKLLLKFKYKEKPYSMIVALIAKSSKYIIIPSILDNNLMVDPASLEEVEIIYTVKEGVFRFEQLTMEAASFLGMRVYNVSTEEDITKLNRREAYRVFIGEVVTVMVTTEDGKKRNVEGILKNISVTGMGIVLKQDFEMGTTMRILYNCEGVHFLLQGMVVRKDKVKGYRAFSYGCLYKEPDNRLNRIIIQKQIRNRKDN